MTVMTKNHIYGALGMQHVPSTFPWLFTRKSYHCLILQMN